MKYSQARQGRIFIIRLEHGEVLSEQLEQFAAEKSIKAAALIAVGGAGKGSKLVAGPEDGSHHPVTPIEYILKDVHEITGTGTIFCNNEGDPVSHIHLACGRKNSTKTGCTRQGVKVWEVMEVIVFELIDTEARRLYEEKTGLELLNPLSGQENSDH